MPVRLLHIELNERAGQLFLFPWRGRFACAQADNHILPPHRLTRTQRDILDDPIALVEDAEHRDALRHRRHAILARRTRGDLPRPGDASARLFVALAARSERKRGQQQGSAAPHVYSGIQGS
jgi:hypothetical protein